MTVRIGLWGATGSGKTTFLSALGLATFRSRDRYGRWDVHGTDFESEEFLNASTEALLDGEFPPSHLNAAGYRWRVSGTAPRRSWGFTHKIRFDLEALDVPGGTFDTGYSIGDEAWHRVLDHFARADGLVYLHDPCRQDNGNYFLGALNRLLGEVGRQGHLAVGGKLPHHLAVCVAKFDDPDVFGRAVKEGRVAPNDDDPFRMPEPTDPQAYYESLAEDLVVRAIATRFAPRRTRYYATSAIGFRARPDGTIDLSNCSNLIAEDDRHRIAGRVHPVNVLEPLVWLAKRARPRTAPPPRENGS